MGLAPSDHLLHLMKLRNICHGVPRSPDLIAKWLKEADAYINALQPAYRHVHKPDAYYLGIAQDLRPETPPNVISINIWIPEAT